MESIFLRIDWHENDFLNRFFILTWNVLRSYLLVIKYLNSAFVEEMSSGQYFKGNGLGHC